MRLSHALRSKVLRSFAAAALLGGVCLSGARADEPADDLGSFLRENGLVGQIQAVGAKVEAKTSNLVLTAMGFLGVPYKRGGNSADTGFDCSGFVRAIYEQTVGLVLPRSASQQAAATQTIARSDLKPGDLVFFNTMRRTFSHVGIYLGEGKFIHSPKPGAQVRVEDMHTRYWEKRFTGARRVEAATPEFTPPTQARPAEVPSLR